MVSIDFWVDTEPRAKQSFKVVRQNNGRGKVTGYTPKQVKEWQERVSTIAREAMHGEPPITGRVAVELNFYLSNNRRVDPDNLSKAVLDALKQIVFEDDCQVCDLHITKTVCEPAGCGVFVREAKEA